jgi:hypothetical protein
MCWNNLVSVVEICKIPDMHMPSCILSWSSVSACLPLHLENLLPFPSPFLQTLCIVSLTLHFVLQSCMFCISTIWSSWRKLWVINKYYCYGNYLKQQYLQNIVRISVMWGIQFTTYTKSSKSGKCSSLAKILYLFCSTLFSNCINNVFQ